MLESTSKQNYELFESYSLKLIFVLGMLISVVLYLSFFSGILLLRFTDLTMYYQMLIVPPLYQIKSPTLTFRFLRNQILNF